MQTLINISAPPYHVQSTAEQLKGGFPYFTHHESVSKLWAQKWRPPCSHGIYPFTDGEVADFDPIFADLVDQSRDDPAILYRPDDYARPFLPVGERLAAEAAEALSQSNPDQARTLYLRSAAVSGSPDFRSTGPSLARRRGDSARTPTRKAESCSILPASP